MPFTYFPDASGGTEVYVHALVQRLAARGYPGAVAAPGPSTSTYMHEGIAVHRFATDDQPRIEYAYGFPDRVAATAFRGIVEKLRPAIVHLHARTSALSASLIDIAHEAEAAVVYTYHTPTGSCARGTMMLYGHAPCDGGIEARRCTACVLSAQGLPERLARIVASAPALVAAPAAALDLRGPFSVLRRPDLIARGCALFGDFIGKVDHVVAVCRWVRDVLERNGVPPAKITLSRQGVSADRSCRAAVARSRAAGPLRIGYFGRVDRTKGADMLAHVLERRPSLDIIVDIYAVAQQGRQPDLELLQARSRTDRRLRFLPPLPPSEVTATMAGYDLIAVPSRWLETGPLVVLEAFAAGVPVLGSDLGGIAEIVRSGVDGILLPVGDVEAWANEIARLAGDSGAVARLRDGVSAPRTMDECADDMAFVYDALTASLRGRPLAQA